MSDTNSVKPSEVRTNLKRKSGDVPPVPEKRKRENKTSGTLTKSDLSKSHPHITGKDKFEFFYGNKSPFSQHHPATFTIDGVTFNCAEQYMMYEKAGECEY